MVGEILTCGLSTALFVQFILIGCDSGRTTGGGGEVASAFQIQVETIEDAPQGMHVLVGVTLNRSQHQMGGFDFMLGYEAAALLLLEQLFEYSCSI